MIEKDGTYYISRTGPNGMNIQVAVRVGQDEREWVSGFLADMHATGYLTREEFEARCSHVLTAVTRDQLYVVTKDLPEDADSWQVWKPKTKKPEIEKKQEPRRRSPSGLAFLAGMLVVLTSAAELAASSLSPLMITQGIVAGILGLAWMWIGTGS